MYQSVMVVLLFSPLVFAAPPKEITKIYNDFSNQKDQLLKADLNKKNAKQKVATVYEALEKALSEVKAIESKSNEDLLTPEGNQMAYDLEILTPIRDLALGIMSKEDCAKARYEHKLNFPVVEDNDSKAVSTAIDHICN